MHNIAGENDGFTIIELMAALTVLAVGFFALAGSIALGFRNIAFARQRQSAVEIANGRLEHLRNLPYASVALSSQPSHNADATDPDYLVSNDATRYDVGGSGGLEALDVDTTNGQLLHFEDPVTVGATQMKVYQYVTWVDDPSITGTQDYKRVTVSILFHTPSVNGVPKIVRASAFVTTNSVTVNGASGGPSVGSPSPSLSSSPSPSPTPTGPCSGDTTPPSGDFSITNGTTSETGYTNANAATLKLQVSDTCTPVTANFSNDNTTYGTNVAVTANPMNVTWTLSGGDGTKNVYGKFTDGAANQKVTGPYSIVVDTTKPTTPGTLTFSKSCAGNDRTVTLSWGGSTDTNFRGYRIYRSIENAAWTAVATVSGTSGSDTHLKSYDSVRFYVVAYDKAGNESNASNTISLSKNQC